MKELIAQWLPLFVGPDDVFEVRGLDVDRPGRKVAGFVAAKRIGAMAGAIAALAEKAGGVYYTPHRLTPDVLSRSAHHLSEVVRDERGVRPKLTSDDDVTARRYLLIDVDPVRAAGFKGQSATDEEKSAAADVIASVRLCLREIGWPEPLVVDSGNGYHLYYKLRDEQPGGKVDSSTDPSAALLRVLAATFDTPRAGIDCAVFNPSRIMKVPGTPARKGTHTADRPHRTSAVREVPHDW